MKDIFIADLASFEEGKLFDTFLLVLSRQLRTTQSNKPYLSLIFCDKTGQLEGRAWEPDDPRIAKDFERGDVVKVRGCISRFNDRLQMKVEQLRKALPVEVDKTDLMPATTYDVDDALAPVAQLCRIVHRASFEAAADNAARRSADRGRVSRSARRKAAAPCLAGRPAGARRQPAYTRGPRRAALSDPRIATCC